MPNYSSLSHKATAFIVDAVRAEPELVLALATGSSPTGCYEQLAKYKADEPHLFDQTHIVKLDEWGGLGLNDSASCEAYLQQYIVQPLDIG